MPFNQLQPLVHILLLVILIIVLVILFLVHQINQLGIDDHETGHPVEAGDYDLHRQLLAYPIQETQEPGVHPSKRFSIQIQAELRRRHLALAGSQFEERAAAEPEGRAQRDEREEEHQKHGAPHPKVLPHVGGNYSAELFKGGDLPQQDRAPDASHANPEENADSSRVHVVGNASELCAEKKDSNKKQLNDVQPSPVPITEEPQSAEFSSFNRSNVPGDVDQSTNPPEATDAQPASYQQASASGINTTTFGSSSNPKPPEATDAKPISDQQASTSGMNATAFGSCANLNKKRKGKKKKKKNSKSKSKSTAYAKGSSSDDAPSDDPNASTDESHHSSIETFSSGFDEKTKIQ